MSLNSPIDTTATILLYIYNHADWDQTIDLHATELPENFTLTKAVLINPDGGVSNDDIPTVNEGFSFWSYGDTMITAKEVNDLLYKIFIKTPEKSVSLSSGTVYINGIKRTLGPIAFREPDTEWPRWNSTYSFIFSDHAT